MKRTLNREVTNSILFLARTDGALGETSIALRDAGYLVVAVAEVDLATRFLRHTRYSLVVADLATLRAMHDGDKRGKALRDLLSQRLDTPLLLGCENGERGVLDLTDSRALLRTVSDALATTQPSNALGRAG